MKSTNKIIYLSLLVSLGLALNIIESTIPIPIAVPGAKLGLANIVTLIAIVMYGLKDAIIITVLRSFTFALAVGAFSSLPYSLSGGILAVFAMYTVYRFGNKYYSLVGISLWGAFAFNVGQVSASSVILENIRIFNYLPIMTLISIFSGFFVGLSTTFIIRKLKVNLDIIESNR